MVSNGLSHGGGEGGGDSPVVVGAVSAVRWAVPGVPFERAADDKPILLSPNLAGLVSAAEVAVHDLAALAKVGFPADDGYALIATQQRLRAVEDQLAAVRYAILPLVERSDVWRLDETVASGRFATWLARHDGVSKGAANREVHLATLLAEQLPATCDKALSGAASAEQVRLICNIAATSQARLDALHSPVTNWQPATDTGTGCDGPDVMPPTGEQFLLDLAGRHSLYQFGRMVRRFAHVSDPESDERGFKDALDREYFQISPTLGGYQLNGFLTEEHGLMVKTAVNNLMDKTLNLSGDIVAARTARTTSQRCAQALADLAQLAMDTGMLGGGAIERRELVVHVSWTELQNVLSTSSTTQKPCSVVEPVETTRHPVAAPASVVEPVETTANPATDPASVVEPVETIRNPAARFTRMVERHPTEGPAQTASALDALVFTDPSADFATYTDGHGYLAPSQLKRLACDSAIRRIVFGPDSQILDVGRSQRTVPAHVRTAVIARDKQCVFQGCDQPPQRCEVHHAVNHWADGGETSAENSALLCWYHHAYTDQHNLKMHYDIASRTWLFSTPQGQIISTKYSLAS